MSPKTSSQEYRQYISAGRALHQRACLGEGLHHKALVRRPTVVIPCLQAVTLEAYPETFECLPGHPRLTSSPRLPFLVAQVAPSPPSLKSAA